MNLFNRKNIRVVKPKIGYKESIGKKTRIKEIADRVVRQNPQYEGLLKEAAKQGKLLQALNAIQSGKLKVRAIKPKIIFYHGALPDKAKQIQRGLEARGIKEYNKKQGYNPKENAAIYVFAGKIPKKYLYRGKVFSKEFGENLPQVMTTKTPQEQAIAYPQEKLDRINKQKARKKLPLNKIEDYEPSLVIGRAEELRKKGIGFAIDPEIKGGEGSAKSYVLVDIKTGKPISKLDPRLMKVVTPDKEKAMTEARQAAENKQVKKLPYEQSAEKHFMSKKAYEEYMKEKEWAEREGIRKKEFEKRMKQKFRKAVDEEAIRGVIESEEERYLKKLVDKKTLKKFLESK